MTVAMAAGVCFAAWGQGTTTTVVQAGPGVTKIAVGLNEVKAVTNGDAVQAAEGATVTIVGAAPAAGQVARLKLTKKEESSSESAQTGENPSTAPNGQTGENPSIVPGGGTGESGTSQSQTVSLKPSGEELREDLSELKSEIQTLENLFNNSDDNTKTWLEDHEVTLAETMTLTLKNYQEGMKDQVVTIASKTTLIAGDEIWFSIAYPTGSNISWLVIKGLGKDDGKAEITIPANTCAQLADKTFLAFLLVPGN